MQTAILIIFLAEAANQIAWAADPLQKLKNALPIHPYLRQLLDCSTCTGFWLGILGTLLTGNIFLPFLISLTARLIEKYSSY